MIIIRLGIQITRRKFVHIAENEFGDQLWVDRSISKLLAWCAENEHYDLLIKEGDRNWRATMYPF